ncbi:hypothetical protein FACS189474_2020 [Bacteroidia bacterium]|nr:hypothetical protein FACS189474_2020 [Bacteroidia bacterium]
MKMKKMIFLMLLSFLGITASMNAQVRIGGTDEPNASAILDLNPSLDPAEEATGGLSLPRVSLKDRDSSDPLPSHVRGMLVYNKTVSVGDDLVEGVYFNNGEKWFPLQTDASASVTLPVIFLRSPTKAWLGVDGTSQDTLFVELASKDPSMVYQWYQKNEDGSSTIVAGAEKDSLFLTKGQYGIEEEGKVYQYFCLVTSGTQYGISGTGRVAYGPGAFIANNTWLRLAPANLGATKTDLAEQLVYEPKVEASGTAANKLYDPTVYGDWYQWGRKKDGHENRTTPVSGTYDGLVGSIDGLATTDLDETGQVKSGTDAYQKFIRRNAGTFDWRQYPGDTNIAEAPAHSWTWGNPQDGITGLDPCKAQNSAWRVPTQLEWAQLAANNAWVWKDGGTDGISGYEIKPAGLKKKTSLFLPAAGRRGRMGGAADGVGPAGYYWSGTYSSSDAYNTQFDASNINVVKVSNRTYGMTVRCIAE